MLKKIGRFFLEKEKSYIKYNEFINRISQIEIPENLHTQKLSSFLTTNKDTKLTKENKNTEIYFKKKHNYQIEESDYKEIIKKSPFGGFSNFIYKDTNFSITGCNYEHIPLENIYKSTLYTKPDVIFLSIRPDEILSDFYLNLRNPKNGKFSQRKYFDQLKMNSNNFLPNKIFENEILNLTKKTFLKNKVVFEQEQQEQIGQKENFFSTEKIPNKIFSILSLYSKINKASLILSEMPDIIFRQIIINKLTICQMREILKKSTYKMVLNPDITPSTPLNFAYTIYPNIFQNPNDLYTSSLIEYYLKIFEIKNKITKNNSISKNSKENKKKHLNISIFSGIGQANSLQSYLFNNKIQSLDKTMIIPENKPLLFKTISLEQYCEKLAIFDVLKLGDFFEKRKDLDLKNSRVVIRKMSGKKKGDPELEYFFKLHEDLILKYYMRFLKDKKIALEEKEDFYINSVF